jgi:hypothetical protein
MGQILVKSYSHDLEPHQGPSSVSSATLPNDSKMPRKVDRILQTVQPERRKTQKPSWAGLSVTMVTVNTSESPISPSLFVIFRIFCQMRSIAPLNTRHMFASRPPFLRPFWVHLTLNCGDRGNVCYHGNRKESGVDIWASMGNPRCISSQRTIGLGTEKHKVFPPDGRPTKLISETAHRLERVREKRAGMDWKAYKLR